MNRARVVILCVVALVALGLGTVAWAQSPAGAAIARRVFASGGSRAASAHAALSGSLGQPFAGASTSATYGLNTGYWLAQQGTYKYYFPIIGQQ